MTTRISPAKPLLALLLAAALATVPGCYKSEADAQKARADKAEAQLKDYETAVANAKRESDSLRTQAQQAKAAVEATKRAVLAVIVDGKVQGTEELKLMDSGPMAGQFVRNGARTRSNGIVRFVDGHLADQMVEMKRDNGKPWFSGNVKDSRPDGDWIWYDNDGKPQNKEVWKAGKLTSVDKATVAKDGKVTWKTGTKAERDAWAAKTKYTFANVPEFIRVP